MKPFQVLISSEGDAVRAGLENAARAHELQILLLLLGPKKAMDQGSAAYKS